MSKIKMTVKQIFDLGLWEKVCDYKGWEYHIYNEGRISDEELVEFDTNFKKKNKLFTSEEYRVLDRMYGLFQKLEDCLMSMDEESQKKISEFHSEHSTLQHCIRWGLQASEEL